MVNEYGSQYERSIIGPMLLERDGDMNMIPKVNVIKTISNKSNYNFDKRCIIPSYLAIGLITGLIISKFIGSKKKRSRTSAKKQIPNAEDISINAISCPDNGICCDLAKKNFVLDEDSSNLPWELAQHPHVKAVTIKGDTGATGTVYLVGTFHIAETSEDLVQKVIDSVYADSLLLELCEDRFGLVKAHRIADRIPSFSDIMRATWAGQLPDMLAQLAVGALENRLGVKMGREMCRAFTAWQKQRRSIAGSPLPAGYIAQAGPVFLGDRPLGQTFHRIWTEMLFWDKLAALWSVICLFWSLMRNNPEDTQAHIEHAAAGSSNSSVSEYLAALATSQPVLYRILVEERDQFLAKSIYTALFADPSERNRSLVVVLGCGHLPGVLKELERIVNNQLEIGDFSVPYYPWNAFESRIVAESLVDYYSKKSLPEFQSQSIPTNESSISSTVLNTDTNQSNTQQFSNSQTTPVMRQNFSSRSYKENNKTIKPITNIIPFFSSRMPKVRYSTNSSPMTYSKHLSFTYQRYRGNATQLQNIPAEITNVKKSSSSIGYVILCTLLVFSLVITSKAPASNSNMSSIQTPQGDLLKYLKACGLVSGDIKELPSEWPILWTRKNSILQIENDTELPIQDIHRWVIAEDINTGEIGWVPVDILGPIVYN